MRAEEIDVWTGFRSADKRINVVAMGDENSLAILCDGGSNDEDTPRSILESHRGLARAGWSVTRIPHRTLQSDGDSCFKMIVKRIT